MAYVVSSDINLGEPEKSVTFGTCLNDLLEGKVHPGVAIDQVAIECLAVLELDQHRVALGGCEEA